MNRPTVTRESVDTNSGIRDCIGHRSIILKEARIYWPGIGYTKHSASANVFPCASLAERVGAP